MTYFLHGTVSVVLMIAYTAIFIASIVGLILPIATFNDKLSIGLAGASISLWENCTRGANACEDITFYCSQSRARFDTARAFSILTEIASVYCVVSCVVALVQLLCYDDVEAAVRALRSCIKGGFMVLAFSLVAFALAIVIQVEPLCESFDKIEDDDGWNLGGGAISTAVGAAFAIVATFFGKLLENRISTSKLGVVA